MTSLGTPLNANRSGFNADLHALIGRTLDRPVAAPIRAMADHVRATCGLNVTAVLAYGSCLRGVDPAESLIDLYVLTADDSGMELLSRIGCRLAPPNVYYAETMFEGRSYRAKYAALPLSQFAARMTAANPYFWARFAQPAALLHAEDRDELIAAIVRATTTLFAHAKGLTTNASAVEIWTAGFRATYATELRPEGPDRAASLVEANIDFYEETARLLAATPPIHANWPLRRFTGKLWSIARLAKAAFTFQGGIDYLAWKIERHSGEKIALSPWQRRHPIFAGLSLLPQLLKRGTVR